MSVFEAAMLICFGASWPISIAKSLRTRIVSGKSPLFMGVLCFGYAFGIIHKLLYSMDWVIALYGLNMVLVAFDLTLYFKYLPNERQGVASQHGGDDGDALEMLTRDDGHDGDVLQLFNNSRG